MIFFYFLEEFGIMMYYYSIQQGYIE